MSEAINEVTTASIPSLTSLPPYAYFPQLKMFTKALTPKSVRRAIFKRFILITSCHGFRRRFISFFMVYVRKLLYFFYNRLFFVDIVYVKECFNHFIFIKFSLFNLFLENVKKFSKMLVHKMVCTLIFWYL